MTEPKTLPVMRVRPVQWLRAAAASSGMNDLYRRRLTEAADALESAERAIGDYLAEIDNPKQRYLQRRKCCDELRAIYHQLRAAAATTPERE